MRSGPYFLFWIFDGSGFGIVLDRFRSFCIFMDLDDYKPFKNLSLLCKI